MQNLLNALTTALQTQLLSAGLLLMVVGSLLVMAKKWPLYIAEWVQRRFVIEVDVHSSSEVFDWLALWLDEQPYSRRARRLTATAKYFGPKPRLIFSPATGNHVFIFQRRLIWLTRERKDPAQGQAIFTMVQVEYFHLRVLGRKQDTVREMLESAQRAYLDATNAGIKVFVSYGWSWTPGHELTVRPFNSVILPVGIAESLLASAREFRSAADWYHQIGIPYRLSFLFWGSPGTGKTSLIAAMAGELKMNLYMLNLGGSGMNDEKLSNLMSEIRSDSIIVFEDIDAAVRGRNIAAGEDGTKGVTFSGLVNALDGIAAREGCLIFMTTNHRDKLDPALVRPGRADVHQEFTYAAHEQVVRLFLRFFPDSNSDLAEIFASTLLYERPQLTMAEAQQHLLKHRRTAEDAIQALPTPAISKQRQA